MAENENGPDPTGEKRDLGEQANGPRPAGDDEYELTAKDAGWRTPTLLISPAKFVYYDPPRPRRQADDA